MSKENYDYDVRVVLYDSTKANIAQIVFFNDAEIALECSRVKIVRDGNRLYFHKGDAVSGSIKLSGKNKNILQLQADFDKVRDLEGLYDARYDKNLDLYYIDKTEKLSEYDGHKYTVKGTVQSVHNVGERDKRGEVIMTAKLTENGKKAAENYKIVRESSKKDLATGVVVNALITLLKTQVVNNDEALATIEALEKFI